MPVSVGNMQQQMETALNRKEQLQFQSRMWWGILVVAVAAYVYMSIPALRQAPFSLGGLFHPFVLIVLLVAIVRIVAIRRTNIDDTDDD